jgi:hypothetical protein
VDRLQQPASDAPSAPPFDDGDRELRRLLVNVARAVLRLREEPVPDEPDRLPALLCDERGVAGTPPTLVEDHDLRVRQAPLHRWQLDVRPPGERGVQHLAEEREVMLLEVADLHHRSP